MCDRPIESFIQKNIAGSEKLTILTVLHSVLVFPPFSPKCRFLAHKVVEDCFPSFCTFSIGQDVCRRLVVCSFDLSQRKAWPHDCIHRKLAYLSSEEKPITCGCDRRKSLMSSSVPMEHSSEKHGRRTLFSDIRKKSTINPKGIQGSGEFNPQTKSSRMKQKRPDMPLYVPRGRRLQESPETQCSNKHTSPGRQKVKRLNVLPLEVQSKRLPQATLIEIHKENPQNKSNSGSELLNSVVEPTFVKDSSHSVQEKLACEMQSNSVSEHSVPGDVDFKSVVRASTASLAEKCLTSDDAQVSVRNVSQLDGISSNSFVKLKSDSTQKTQQGNLKFSDHQISTNQNVSIPFSDSVPSNSAATVVSLSTVAVNFQNVSKLSLDTSVPLVNEDVDEISIPSVKDKESVPFIGCVTGKESVPVIGNETDSFTCVVRLPGKSLPSEPVCESIRTETEPITVESNLNRKSVDESDSHCSLSTSVYDSNGSSNIDFEYSSVEVSSAVVGASHVEDITVDKSTVIENLPNCVDSVEVITSERISCVIKGDNGCEDEDFNSNLNHNLHIQSSASKSAHKQEFPSSHASCQSDQTEVEESLDFHIADTDLSSAPVNVESANESATPNMPASSSLLSGVTAPPQSEENDLKRSPKRMEICGEKMCTGSKTIPDNEDNFDSSLEVESWDSMFDDDGECLNPEVLRELIAAVGDVEIKTSKKDYAEYKPLESTVDEEFGNVIEIYGFPVEFSTQDLISAFSCFRNQDFSVKWVDDCHALGIFSGTFAATEALTLQHPYVKVRPLSQGIKESKLKAKRCAEHLLPYKPRPATSATLARRLVTGALGLKPNVSREQREIERLAIKQARDRKRQVAKQRQDIWDGIVS